MLPAVGSRLILRSGGRRVIPPPGRGAACARGLQPPKVLQGFDPVSPRQDHRHAAPVLYGLGDVAVPFREQCQLSMRGDKGWVQGKRGSVRPPSLFAPPARSVPLRVRSAPPAADTTRVPLGASPRRESGPLPARTSGRPAPIPSGALRSWPPAGIHLVPGTP